MDLIDRIERTLDTLRPYIASHRGHVEVVDFDESEGILLLRLGGTCHGCAASTITLKQGIESRLRQMVPEVKHVRRSNPWTSHSRLGLLPPSPGFRTPGWKTISSPPA
jgi:Fe-S cluster biogenesis protein NfuA